MLENSSLENIDLHLLKPTSSVCCHLMTHDFLRNQTVNDHEVLFFGHFSWPTRYCRPVFVLATASAVDQRSELYLQLSLLLPILISDLSFRWNGFGVVILAVCLNAENWGSKVFVCSRATRKIKVLWKPLALSVNEISPKISNLDNRLIMPITLLLYSVFSEMLFVYFFQY